MRQSIMKRFVWSGATFVSLVSALLAQGTWTWQKQCDSNEWSAICYNYDGCGYDQNGSPVHRYFNNWGLSQCSVSPGLPGLGSICIFPAGANALLSSNVDILSISISNGAVFSWQDGSLTLRNPIDNSPSTLSNLGLLRMVGSLERGLSGVLVNTGTLVHEAGSTYFNGASLRNSATAEIRRGNWYSNTGTNSFVNTGTLNKTTTNSFTITVPMQQQNATVNVQAGTLTLSAGSNTHQNVSWSVASGATLVLNGTHTFSGTHSGWSVASGATLVLQDGTHTFSGTHSSEITGTLVQTGGTVQAGSEGATFNFTGTGYQWVQYTLDGGSAGLTNTGILRMVGSLERGLSGVLVNTGTLIHEAGSTYFNGASLRNSATAEIRRGNWYSNTGTNSFVNTGTLNKTTTNSFTITVPMQQQNATVNVQAGTLTLSAGSNTHQNVSWSVASGATLVLQDGTHTFSGTHSGEIAGTLVQTNNTVQAGSEGATFTFTGTGYQWVQYTLDGGSAGLTNTGILRMVGSLERGLSGVLVNTGTLVHEAGSTYFNGASLRNSATAEIRRGNWYSNTGTNSFVNTGTLNKTTTNSFTITVPMQQQNATVNVQAGTLTLSAGSNTHQNVSWSVASGATLVLNGTHTFSGTHSGWSVASGATLVLQDGTHTFSGTHSSEITGTLVQTGGTVQAGSEGATFNFTGTGYQWVQYTLDGGSAGLTNTGILRMVGSLERGLSGVLVNTGTLIHEAGSTYFNGASLRNSATAEIRRGNWYSNTGTNSFVNTGTLNKTTTNSFTITVPMQQQNATVNVQAGTLTLSAGSNTHQNVSWSVASGATLVLQDGTHTFSGTHSGEIAGTLVQTNNTVQAGSEGATFTFTGTGYQWVQYTLDGGSAGLTNTGILRMVGSLERGLSGVLVNTGTLIHEAGSTYFNGASLRNSGDSGDALSVELVQQHRHQQPCEHGHIAQGLARPEQPNLVHHHCQHDQQRADRGAKRHAERLQPDPNRR
jgi:hypothetical protein